MGEINSYKDLLVWQKSVKLVTSVYNLVKEFPEHEKFGLSQQMRRSAVSIPSNIAEGWGRFSRKNYMQFLRIARGSLFELETQIILAVNLEYINKDNTLEVEIIEISKMLNALIRRLEEKV